MFTRMKIALVFAGSLVCGVAAAQVPRSEQGSGKPDFKEMHQAKRDDMLQKIDTNKDGKLDDAERAAAHEARAVDRFKKLDTDGNGVLSLAEFKAGKHGKMGKRHARGGRGMHRGGGTQ
jgi:hypothetical protein